MIHTVPLGGAVGASRGPPETTAYCPSTVMAVPFGVRLAVFHDNRRYYPGPDIERLHRGTFQTPATKRPQRIDALVPEANLHTLVLPRSTQGMVLFETPLMRTYF